MLNVWVNRPKDESLLITNPDTTFMDYMDFSLLKTDFAIEVMKNLSKVDKIHNPRTFTTEWGYLISLKELSGGAKETLLMMCKEVRETGLIFSYGDGDDCNAYLEKIASEHDVNIYLSGSYYIPSKEYIEKYGARFVESDTVVYKVMDFWDEMLNLRDK